MKPHAPAALMVMIRMGVVTELVTSGQPKTAKELFNSCSGDELLIGRTTPQTSYTSSLALLTRCTSSQNDETIGSFGCFP